jgi:hypothetical protein
MYGFGSDLIQGSLLSLLRVRRTRQHRANQAAKGKPDELMATTAENYHDQDFLSKIRSGPQRPLLVFKRVT